MALPIEPNLFRHISYPQAYAIAAMINGVTNSADELCRAGFAYPVAQELQRQIGCGVGDVGKLHMLGFSVDDAKAIAAAVPYAGAFAAAVLAIVMNVDPADTANWVSLGMDSDVAARIAANAAGAAAFVARNAGG